ncbi:uncharacterized protein LOC133865485 [Alnus glutinosa]|uniref:uncharacterized protein LOC133865485 n=1 Tax=Alnus glutinosa TaxID=3517 RepID=UPI002D790FEE|nr:uncharacterized protein LOC133865485 [Alnus glutinosa]XP_062157881.1 uncharacterized protein LOC133865485 [Alnus glutinosa]
MGHLTRINFGGTGISSIRLNPEDLVLEGCTNLDKFPEKIGDSVQSMPSNVFMKESEVSSPAEKLSWLPPANLRVSNGGWPSIAFPAVRESNFSSTLVALHLSWSGIVTIPTCIKRFVSLKELGLDHCKQLREILAFPPNTSSGVKAEGCMSLELYKNKCWLPELPIAGPSSGLGVLEASTIRGPGQNKLFNILVSGNKIPDWFDYRKEVSNSTSCEIDIDMPTDLDGEITRIAFSAVVEAESSNGGMIDVYVISGGVEIFCGGEGLSRGGSTCVWLGFHVPKMAYNGHLRVKCVYKSVTGRNSFDMKSCGVHLVRR